MAAKRQHCSTTALLTIILWVVAGVASGSQAPLVYRLVEELPAGTVVGNVKNDSAALQRHPPEVLAQLEFSLQHSSGVYALFRLDRRTGVLTIVRPLDREALYPDTTIELSIRVMPARYFAIVKVAIVIIDVNDNPPHFPEPQVALVVPETTRPGAIFALPTAEDVDGGQYDVRTYELHGADLGTPPPDGKFGLRLANHSDGSLDVKLVLLDTLDYEQSDSYTLVLLALDGGTPPLSGTLEIHVTVADANDNAPHFPQAQYEASVAENAPPGTTLAVVTAVDDDAELNGLVTYKLGSSTISRDAVLFYVNSTTGVLSLVGSLDYEISSVYTVDVVAQDGGVQPQTAFARVVIAVEDVNDNAPVITFHTLQATGDSETANNDEGDKADDAEDAGGSDGAEKFAEVVENTLAGAFVAHLTATDADTGVGGQVECSVEGESSRLFTLQRTLQDSDEDVSEKGNTVEYRLVTSVQFDRETRDTYRVNIVCSDNGQTSLSSTETLIVHVSDQNDNSPSFARQMYHATITENNAVGDIVVVAAGGLEVRDVDIGTNAVLTYSIAPMRRNHHGLPTRDLLSINAQTGVIQAMVVFDYESEAGKSGYLFQVSAVDNGQPARTATALLNLTIVDTNDEYPVFSKERYVFLVSENVPPPSLLGVVLATDGDGPRFSQVTYSIVHQDSGSGGNGFAIDSYSGQLVTIRPLDREVQATYILVIQASNPVVATGSKDDVIVASLVNVTVVVLDVNDNAPVFRNPSPVNSTVSIRNDVPHGFVITRLHAVDADAGAGAVVTYAIASGNDDGNFHVDGISGELTTARFLTSYINNMLKLTVSAQDSGIPSMMSLAVVYIHVAQRTGVGIAGSTSAMAKSSDDLGHSQGEESRLGGLSIAGLPEHLTFALVVTIGALVGLLVIAVSAIVLAVLCLNSRRQRQRLRAEQDAKKRADEAAALLLKAAHDERGGAGSASPATSLLWNTTCAADDNDTMDILRDLPVFTGGMRTQYHRPPDSCHHGRQCCGNGSRRHPNQTISHACHQTGGTLYAQRENLSLPCLLPVPKRCHYCAGPHTRSQGSCENDMDMFSEDGSITDSGRGGSEQGEHVSTSIRPLPPADTALVPASHLSDLAESGEDLPLPPPPTEYRSMETQSCDTVDCKACTSVQRFLPEV